MEEKYWSVPVGGIILLAVNILTVLSLIKIRGMDSLQAARVGLGGGYVGGVVAYALLHLIGRVGTYIVLIVSSLVAVVMILNQPLSVILDRVSHYGRSCLDRLDEMMFYEAEEEREPVIVNPPAAPIADTNTIPLPVSEVPIEISVPEVREPAAPRVIIGDKSDYRRPPLDLLTPVQSDRSYSKSDIKESIQVLEDTFANFGIKIKVNQVSCGPAVTRYELQPAPGVKVSKIISLSDDLQLSLAAPGIRIEAPIPGKSAVGIEVPNDRITRVGLRNLLAAPAFQERKSPLTVGLGRTYRVTR